MSDIDKLIDDALDAEERDLMHRIGDEPDYFTQVFGIFRGKTGWASAVLVVVQLLMFIAGVWMALRFFDAASPLEALRWGLPAATLILMALIVKMAFWPQIHIQRLSQELKRIELQVVRLRKN
ncbi:DUF6768 family protein [Sphingomicrobium marinum]|uniref:DUF6768 family protein n=1 Tax=Sphingomicrobium marinum TaxID=1227950 RepID=UPI002240649F|nr:DUF6768 family protein [Sphingomicrobium marinum]